MAGKKARVFGAYTGPFFFFFFDILIDLGREEMVTQFEDTK